jgi:hypothetical protein
MLCPLVLAAVTTPSAAQAPDGMTESWVLVTTEKVRCFVRVDGGPPKQVDAPQPRRRDERGFQRWRGGDRDGMAIEGGKRVVFREQDPATKGKKFDDWRYRVMIADPDVNNPKQLITGLKWNQMPRLAPDGKSLFCGADEGGAWYLYRVPFDGSPPVKIGKVAGLDHPSYRVLPDGRALYMPVTAWHVENVQIGTWTTGKGPVILTDGKTETVLLKETVGGLPEVSDDASKMAVTGTNAAGERAVEVTDLKTGKSEQFLLKAFHKDWACQFGAAKFSPDGRAVAVTFAFGGVVIREKGPRPGDEAEEHFGVAWLDGRKDRTALFRLDQPRKEHGYFHRIESLEWSAGPEAKK